MAVGYQGNTTNFSGVGAPNPKLWVPEINQIQDAATRTAMLKVQQWCQNLVSPSIRSLAGQLLPDLLGVGDPGSPFRSHRLPPALLHARWDRADGFSVRCDLRGKEWNL